MRKPFFAANWKMNHSEREAVAFIEKFLILARDIEPERADVVIAPPFTSIAAARDRLEGSAVNLAGQNCHWEKAGAFTGEISPLMLKESGCAYVILGHSERRHQFMENDETVNQKLKAALAAGLKPILCVGERLEEREADRTFSIVEMQLTLNAVDIGPERLGEITIAYEPVWAIGTGKTATPRQAEDVHKFIRDFLAGNYGDDISGKTRILYGGSVKVDNIRALMECENIDGALVGGASLDAETFHNLVKNGLVS